MTWVWLSEILRIFADLIPRPRVKTPDEAVVVFWFGVWPWKREKWWSWSVDWPLLHRYEVVLLSEQVATDNLCSAGLTSTWQCGYWVVDPVEACLRCADVNATVCRVVNSILEVGGNTDDAEEKINAELLNYGVQICELTWTDKQIITVSVN